VPSAHHVVGEDGQQQFQFIRVDVDVGLDCISGPDVSALKHLGEKKESLVPDKIKKLFHSLNRLFYLGTRGAVTSWHWVKAGFTPDGSTSGHI